ncbi:MAG: site-specific DNA-methyltransferase [Candidatus Portnoybacteria bacterium CG10_big_fil_rev_8_21_14_0_10_44_7]|uniref:Methyltransferase n=1 Tax=Candidatus Portnoybacteria bacterium CG10_big_fil_rev_8_21_14_0_10_44_7 TaxID=1974816 RepID=A0A2M8KIY9_9BACT|nr:MAG: site-specific DNA-methyltransferase [Candidatus Portnoybacteria bacterium CG10_big_fil_rev_8_21_14_0_10_44_7]
MKPINKIIKGDALTVLKKIDANFIDLGITSPPYNKGEKHKGWLVKNVKYDQVVDNKPEGIYQEEQVAVLNEIYRATKPGGSFFYNHKTRWDKGEMLHPMDWLRKTKWVIKQEIIWDRIIAANIRGWRFWQVDERVYWLYKPKRGNKIGKELKSKHALLTSIWRIPPERKNGHPAPFPLILPIRIIYSLLNKTRGLVLDPYAGSGTTCLAAKLLGVNYIGIEISNDYINETKKRLNNAEKYRQVINEEIKKHYVEKTFKERKVGGDNTGKFGNYKGVKQATLL